MALSVVDPINSAIERAKRVCFRPFDLGKWFTIGFCAFLAGLAEGGSTVPTNFNFNASGPPGGGQPNGRKLAEDFRDGIDWVQAHLTPILVIGLIVLSVVIALMALVNWLGSRGQFMFIDNIGRNRGAVAAPWSEYRKEGNSLFWFRFLFSFAVLAVFFAIPVGAVLIALPDIQAETFGSAAATGLAVGIGGFLVWGIGSALVNLFLNDFVVPIMYVRRIGVLEAWHVFGTSMLAGHLGIFVLYVLFKIVLAFGVGFLTVLLGCCTLCIGFIPYLGSHVLLLPLHVFWRSYSLYFIEQFGPEWRIFSTADERFAELVDEGEWPDEHFRPGDEDIRPPDDRIRPE
jgi:hypothetical protein